MVLQALDTLLHEDVLRALVLILAGLTGGVVGAMAIRFVGAVLIKIAGFVLGGMLGIWLASHLFLGGAAF